MKICIASTARAGCGLLCWGPNDDGIVSVSSLIVGVAAANPGPTAILVTGAAGLAAGAMSMAAGKYVSVSS